MCGTLRAIITLPPVVSSWGVTVTGCDPRFPKTNSTSSVLQAAEGQATLPVTLQEQEHEDDGYNGNQCSRYYQRIQTVRPAPRARQIVPRSEADSQRVELGGAEDHKGKEVVVPGRIEEVIGDRLLGVDTHQVDAERGY